MSHEYIDMPENYPVGIMSQFVPEPGEVENTKTRRRRREGKSGDGEGSGSLIMSKRKLSEEQQSILEQSFRMEHKLTTERKDGLAAELGLDPRQVAVWFQNRRVRRKNKKFEEEFSELRSHHESLMVEKCRLETEVLELKEQLTEAKRKFETVSNHFERVKYVINNLDDNPSSSQPMEQHFHLENLFPETNYAHVFQCGDHDFDF